MNWLVTKLMESLQDGDKGSFGRIYSLPFLAACLVLSIIDGAFEIYRHEDVSETVIILASIAGGLYGGSKGLTTMQRLRGDNVKQQSQAPSFEPTDAGGGSTGTGSEGEGKGNQPGKEG